MLRFADRSQIRLGESHGLLARTDSDGSAVPAAIANHPPTIQGVSAFGIAIHSIRYFMDVADAGNDASAGGSGERQLVRGPGIDTVNENFLLGEEFTSRRIRDPCRGGVACGELEVTGQSGCG